MAKRAAAPGKPCRSLLLGVTGSIGSVFMPHFVYILRRYVADEVHVILSHAARAFVTPYALEIFSGNTVFTEGTERTERVRVPHIDLPRQADLFLVMPATANVLAKAAHGIADDLLTTALLACQAPVVFVPSMNASMWRHRAVTANAAACRALGYHVVPPGKGYAVSDMEMHEGAMAPIEEVIAVVEKILARRPRARGTDSR